MIASQAVALVAQEPFTIPSSKAISGLIERVETHYDARSKQNERLFMNETFQEYFNKAKPGEIFHAENFRKEPVTMDNSELTQSWRDEAALALDGKPSPVVYVKGKKSVILNGQEDFYQHFYLHSPIAIAKRIAKAKIYEAIQNNWQRLKNTDFNDQLDCSDARNCKGFDDVVLKNKMPEDFFFSYPLSVKNNSGNYIFEFQGLGYVEVSKTLKSGRVIFGVGYLNDNNRPERGSENLRTDVEAGLAPPPKPSDAPAPDSTTPKE